MKEVLIIGSGRSSASLLSYLSAYADDRGLAIKVVDRDEELLAKRRVEFPSVNFICADISDLSQLLDLINQSKVVISLLPATLHLPIIKACIQLKRPVLTASYVSEEIKGLHKVAQDNGVLVLMEMGLDPGIDHMSAKRDLDKLKRAGGKIKLFKSFTGGLMSPGSDDNPWEYKLTWNPKNVVLSGVGGVKFRRNNKYKFIPYHKLYDRTELIQIDGFGAFEAYPNRDSLKYEEQYGLTGVPTILRGTLRRPGFCQSWNHLVQLGYTSDAIFLTNLEGLSYRDFTNALLSYDTVLSVEEKLKRYLELTEKDFRKLEWLGLFSDELIQLSKATPAQVLQKLLEEKWKLDPKDKDMVVMNHRVEYELNGELRVHESSLVLQGENADSTSMAKTVGLPLGIAALMVLEGQIDYEGVVIPVHEDIYGPVMKELEALGLKFATSDKAL